MIFYTFVCQYAYFVASQVIVMEKILLTHIIETLSFGDRVFRTLRGLEPQFDARGRMVLTSGRKSVVFCARYRNENYALKCYLCPQPVRKQQHDFLRTSSESIIIHPQLFERELYVNNTQIDISLYQWVDGHTLEWMMRKAIHDENHQLLGQLLKDFLRFATTLLECEWRHGDLKPENIIVRPNGEMILVDCDALYAPSLPPSAEGGTPQWVHPARKDNYDSHIDDYAIALIVVSLAALRRDLSLCKSESAVAMPPQQNRATINLLLADSEPLLLLHEALYAPTHKINNLKTILKCIMHTLHDNTKPHL